MTSIYVYIFFLIVADQYVQCVLLLLNWLCVCASHTPLWTEDPLYYFRTTSTSPKFHDDSMNFVDEWRSW